MNNLFKIGMGALAVTAATSFAGQYPFPQNMKYPNGHIIEYADTDMIKKHYELWKQAWYQASNGWVLAPEGTCSTVSEAIAYGMLITVYMDEEETFKKLYDVWKNNGVGGSSGAGMNWRIGCSSDNGSATDADEDAALALVMASKQWNNTSYLNDAKTLIDWIATNDVDGNNSLKPGSNWNPALNPSYVMPGHYRLFEKVANDSKWSTIRTKAMNDLLACQDSKTGLVGDWCSWSDHKTISSPGAAVSNDIGFYDDAARTPWRTAWGYYWYGDSDAKKFNETVVKWLIPETRTASGVNSGYKYVNGKYEVDDSDKRRFVSSTFSGGLGLATSSIDSDAAKTYLGTVYKVLKKQVSCASAEGCGESVSGEKYYPATLNVLYLLMVTGNMPNLYDLTGFTKFTPDTTKAPSVAQIGGVQQKMGDSTVSVSGLWNWGAYHDKLGIGTKMVPDSGASPLFKKDDGSIYAEASMEIGPEPDYVPGATLKYPSAGIAVSFKSDACKATKSCGVDLSALGVKYVRVTAKTSGPIRMAVLNTITDENAEKNLKNLGAGSEPGIYVDNTEDYTAVTYDMTPYEWGFVGVKGNKITILDWVDKNAPNGADILKNVKGFKWEVKDAKGGLGEISIKSVEFLDENKNIIDPSKITGMTITPSTDPGTDPGTNPGTDPGTNPGTDPGTNPGTDPGTDPGTNPGTDPGTNPGTDPTNPAAIQMAQTLAMAKISVAGMNIAVDGAKAGADIAVFSLQGNKIASVKATFGNASVTVPTKGIYLVRVGNKISKVTVK